VVVYILLKTTLSSLRQKKVIFTCDANEKLGPGDLFLLPMGPPGPPPPPPTAALAAPFRLRRFLAGREDSKKT
jgi:hypothetical protein